MNFTKGDKVRVKPECINGYAAEFSNKVKDGRIGEIMGYQGPPSPNSWPIVWFHARGRKKLYRAGMIHPADLELVI